MNEEKNIVVIGGDARYIELIRQLQRLKNVNISLVGFDQLEQSFTSLKQIDLEDVDQKNVDIIILPITGINEEGKVEVVFSDANIILQPSWFEELKTKTKVFTGITNSYLTKIAKDAQVNLIPLLNRDDIAILNSIPTAEGTLMMAMEYTDYTIHSSEVVVVGFGRVGHTVARTFSALGAKVSVGARSKKDLARIKEMGLHPIPLEKLSANVNTCDILINTIPALVITKEEIKQLPSHSLIIDLASSPGGTDFDYANKRGIQAILSKSLPGIVAPKTAGKILADVIVQMI